MQPDYSYLWEMNERPVPRIYGLSWQAEPPAIIFQLHKYGLKIAAEKFPTALIIKHLEKELALEPFSFDWQGKCGFNGAFTFTGERDDFIHYQLLLPITEWLTQQDCAHCKGAGLDPDFDDICSNCFGFKKTNEFSRKEQAALSSTLYCFMSLTSFVKDEKFLRTQNDFFPQLFDLNICLAPKMGGKNIGINISKFLTAWLFLHEVDAKKIEGAMIAAALHMEPLNRWLKSEILYFKQEGYYISFGVPGDRCNWGNHIRPKEIHGYEIAGHNVDTFS